MNFEEIMHLLANDTGPVGVTGPQNDCSIHGEQHDFYGPDFAILIPPSAFCSFEHLEHLIMTHDIQNKLRNEYKQTLKNGISLPFLQILEVNQQN